MRIKKAIAAAAAFAGVAAVGVFGASAPAAAAPGNGVIEYGEFVLWEHSNYGGALYDSNGNLANYSGYFFVNSGTQLNDRASSIANYHQTRSLRTYQHANYTYPYISVLPYGQASGNVSWAYYSLGSFNDNLSSHLFF
ncbi:peptidase inhibitor family I36 protein [Phytohabitans aurantiacus]|jgi:hypothetical protein|uniref:peptidase inhibitor family I36 protein n=1 Tax=Phytohabitans aurantiacus TaxID=3016789 RepID=UPI002493706B|nr:peptidase inhibitor family I36 protein [Phytohabitans aurantiacus]